MSEKGIAVIFITHRLHEILSVCDTVVVMRDGYVVQDIPAARTTVNEISKWMVGRNVGIAGTRDIRDTSDARTVLSIRRLWVLLTTTRLIRTDSTRKPSLLTMPPTT